MPSLRETALQGLLSTVATALAPIVVQRGGTRPEKIPTGGIAILQDGTPGEPEVTLSPRLYHYEHRADVEVYIPGATSASRSTAIDNALVALGNAIDADHTLNGQCEYAHVGALELLDDESVEGGTDVKRALVSMVLYYSTLNPIT